MTTDCMTGDACARIRMASACGSGKKRTRATVSGFADDADHSNSRQEHCEDVGTPSKRIMQQGTDNPAAHREPALFIHPPSQAIPQIPVAITTSNLNRRLSGKVNTPSARKSLLLSLQQGTWSSSSQELNCLGAPPPVLSSDKQSSTAFTALAATAADSSAGCSMQAVRVISAGRKPRLASARAAATVAAAAQQSAGQPTQDSAGIKPSAALKPVLALSSIPSQYAASGLKDPNKTGSSPGSQPPTTPAPALFPPMPPAGLFTAGSTGPGAQRRPDMPESTPGGFTQTLVRLLERQLLSDTPPGNSPDACALRQLSLLSSPPRQEWEQQAGNGDSPDDQAAAVAGLAREAQPGDAVDGSTEDLEAHEGSQQQQVVVQVTAYDDKMHTQHDTVYNPLPANMDKGGYVQCTADVGSKEVFALLNASPATPPMDDATGGHTVPAAHEPEHPATGTMSSPATQPPLAGNMLLPSQAVLPKPSTITDNPQPAICPDMHNPDAPPIPCALTQALNSATVVEHDIILVEEATSAGGINMAVAGLHGTGLASTHSTPSPPSRWPDSGLKKSSRRRRTSCTPPQVHTQFEAQLSPADIVDLTENPDEGSKAHSRGKQSRSPNHSETSAADDSPMQEPLQHKTQAAGPSPSSTTRTSCHRSRRSPPINQLSVPVVDLTLAPHEAGQLELVGGPVTVVDVTEDLELVHPAAHTFPDTLSPLPIASAAAIRRVADSSTGLSASTLADATQAYSMLAAGCGVAGSPGKSGQTAQVRDDDSAAHVVVIDDDDVQHEYNTISGHDTVSCDKQNEYRVCEQAADGDENGPLDDAAQPKCQPCELAMASVVEHSLVEEGHARSGDTAATAAGESTITISQKAAPPPVMVAARAGPVLSKAAGHPGTPGTISLLRAALRPAGITSSIGSSPSSLWSTPPSQQTSSPAHANMEPAGDDAHGTDAPLSEAPLQAGSKADKSGKVEQSAADSHHVVDAVWEASAQGWLEDAAGRAQLMQEPPQSSIQTSAREQDAHMYDAAAIHNSQEQHQATVSMATDGHIEQPAALQATAGPKMLIGSRPDLVNSSGSSFLHKLPGMNRSQQQQQQQQDVWDEPRASSNRDQQPLYSTPTQSRPLNTTPLTCDSPTQCTPVTTEAAAAALQRVGAQQTPWLVHATVAACNRGPMSTPGGTGQASSFPHPSYANATPSGNMAALSASSGDMMWDSSCGMGSFTAPGWDDCGDLPAGWNSGDGGDGGSLMDWVAAVQITSKGCESPGIMGLGDEWMQHDEEHQAHEQMVNALLAGSPGQGLTQQQQGQARLQEEQEEGEGKEVQVEGFATQALVVEGNAVEEMCMAESSPARVDIVGEPDAAVEQGKYAVISSSPSIGNMHSQSRLQQKTLGFPSLTAAGGATAGTPNKPGSVEGSSVLQGSWRSKRHNTLLMGADVALPCPAPAPPAPKTQQLSSQWMSQDKSSMPQARLAFTPQACSDGHQSVSQNDIHHSPSRDNTTVNCTTTTTASAQLSPTTANTLPNRTTRGTPHPHPHSNLPLLAPGPTPANAPANLHNTTPEPSSTPSEGHLHEQATQRHVTIAPPPANTADNPGTSTSAQHNPPVHNSRAGSGSTREGMASCTSPLVKTDSSTSPVGKSQSVVASPSPAPGKGSPIMGRHTARKHQYIQARARASARAQQAAAASGMSGAEATPSNVSRTGLSPAQRNSPQLASAGGQHRGALLSRSILDDMQSRADESIGEMVDAEETDDEDDVQGPPSIQATSMSPTQGTEDHTTAARLPHLPPSAGPHSRRLLALLPEGKVSASPQAWQLSALRQPAGRLGRLSSPCHGTSPVTARAKRLVMQGSPCAPGARPTGQLPNRPFNMNTCVAAAVDEHAAMDDEGQVLHVPRTTQGLRPPKATTILPRPLAAPCDLENRARESYHNYRLAEAWFTRKERWARMDMAGQEVSTCSLMIHKAKATNFMNNFEDKYGIDMARTLKQRLALEWEQVARLRTQACERAALTARAQCVARLALASPPSARPLVLEFTRGSQEPEPQSTSGEGASQLSISATTGQRVHTDKDQDHVRGSDGTEGTTKEQNENSCPNIGYATSMPGRVPARQCSSPAALDCQHGPVSAAVSGESATRHVTPVSILRQHTRCRQYQGTKNVQFAPLLEMAKHSGYRTE